MRSVLRKARVVDKKTREVFDDGIQNLELYIKTRSNKNFKK